MKRIAKSELSKLKFFLGFNPRVERTENKRSFIPSGKKAVILISADFELAWAPRYDSSVSDPLKYAILKATNERKNIPLILELCDRFDIPITWATVGHLFLDKCSRSDGHVHNEIPRVSSYENKYWKFNSLDWFEYDPCTDYRRDPLWYAPDLIESITKTKTKHEIGNHTFSHIDCRDNICPPDLLKAELKVSKAAAEKFGIQLRSFVHPGHTIGNLDVLAEEGFSNFRTDYDNILGYPKKYNNQLWELQQTAQFSIRQEWSINYHIYRYKKIIERAMRTETVCVFWFHPSFDKKMIEEIWPQVFKYMNDNRKDLWITTHSEYINWLKNNQ